MSDFHIGHRSVNSIWSGPVSFTGLIDEVHTFARALSVGEIQAIHDAGSSGFCPPYTFAGFFPPVRNLPSVNSDNAGRAIPIKFSLGGDQGLDILAAGSPASQPVSCNTGAPLGAVTPTVAVGGGETNDDSEDGDDNKRTGTNSLKYDREDGRYLYVWKTRKSWANSCRDFILTLNDESVHRARFRFARGEDHE